MRFYSTRNIDTDISFREGVFSGLAPDGGLYHPAQKADILDICTGFSPEAAFTEIAAAVTGRLFSDEIPQADADSICTAAFPFSPNLEPMEDGITLLELYHGPSYAFKDFGASYLATMMEYFLERENKKAIILTATSGDTGSAVAKAFHKKENIEVVILYPSGRVSPLQEKQLTTVGDNVTALEVKGSFDDCQRMVKEAFVDPILNRALTLTSANSINLGRLIPQSFYYLYSYIRMSRHHSDLVFCVPSGNFGNLTAGVLAWSWGMPVRGFLAATNINDVVPEYLKTGIYSPRSSVQTYSNAMDVGNPSNFERLTAIFDNDREKMHEIIHEEVISDSETLETVKTVYKDMGRFIDPHTAVGYLASKRYLNRRNRHPGHIITLATAHPGKFLEIVTEATGSVPKLPEQLKKAMDLPKSSILIENTLEKLSAFLLDRFA